MYLKMMNSNLFAIFSIFSLVVRASDEFMRPSSELGLALERLLKHESFIRLNSAFYGPQLVMQKTVLADILENTDAMKELIEENDVLKKELGRYQLSILADYLRDTIEKPSDDTLIFFDEKYMEMMKLFMRDVGNLKIAVMKKEACGQGKGVTKSLLPEYGTKLGDQIKFKLEDGKTPAPRAEVKLIDHKFLTQKVEGEMEFLATFHSADRPLNESILYRVLGVGEDEIPAHLEQTEGHVAILASVGSSSTQIFTLKEVIGGLLIGTDQILENPRVAELFLSEIIDVVRKKEIMAPLILMGSIGQSVEMTTDLKELKWDTNYKEVARKGNRDYEKWLHTLPALGFACRDSGWEDRCIMQERQIEEDKLKSKWLPVMAESLWNDYCSRSDYDPEVTGIYVTDYGGSGPNLFYYDSLKHKMSSVARDVGLLRGKQPVFVTEMMRGKEEESEGFRKSVDFFEKNISEHAEKNGIRKIVLYIRQTGMIRQQFFLHTLEPKIVFDTFESDGWERFEKKRSVK